MVLTSKDLRPILSVDRAAANLPQSTTETIFEVNGGYVEVIAIIGQIGTVIQAQANATKLQFDAGGGGQDLCATLDINADAADSLYTFTGTTSDPMVNSATGILSKQEPWILFGDTAGATEIILNCAASNTGTIRWKIYYRPIDAGATITSA